MEVCTNPRCESWGCAEHDPADDWEPPPYSKPGRILVEVLSISRVNPRIVSYEVEILDYDGDSSVFWLQEGGYMDYWIQDKFDFDYPDSYVIEGITGEYIRGDGYSTDDDERWYHERVRKATVDEIMFECLM